jgi:Development and cell death domain
MKRICIFLCSNQTYVECVTKNLFGSDKPWPMEVHKGDTCCLYHYGTKTLLALWQAESEGANGIIRSAWSGRYPFQVRVKLLTTEIVSVPPTITNEFTDASDGNFKGIIVLNNTDNFDQFISGFMNKT